MRTPALRWFQRCTSVCLGILLGCGISEAIARACGLGQVTLTRGTLHEFHPEVGWICAPHCDTDYEMPGSFRVHVRCNSVGMRDHEFARDVPDGIQRFAVLGDSFMWGFGVENEEIFAKRIEASVSDIEVLNFGTNGYSTVQELVRYQCDARAYHPRVVILAVCWNDLEDNFDSKKNGRVYLKHENDGFHIANRPVQAAWKPSFVQELRHISSFFRCLEYAGATWKLRSKEAARLAQVGADAEERSSDGIAFSLLELHAQETPDLAMAWDAMRFALLQLRDAVQADGASLFVLFDAIKETRSVAAFESAIVAPAGSRARELKLVIDRPAHRLGQICAELDLPFVDLGAAFRNHPSPDQMFLRSNNHWSAAGHRLAAVVVEKELRQRGLMQNPPR